MDESKNALRLAVLSQRHLLPSTQFEALSRSIQDRVLVLSLYQFAEGVALYSAVQNEVSTDDIRDDALRLGKSVFFPRLEPNGSLVFVEIQSSEDFSLGKFGIREPRGQKLLDHHNEIDLLMVVPGVAFDPNGNRLGRGHGFYDRLLQSFGKRATTVGLAYEFQLVSSVPVESWDEKVRFIVTEERLIDCLGVQEHAKTGF